MSCGRLLTAASEECHKVFGMGIGGLQISAGAMSTMEEDDGLPNRIALYLAQLGPRLVLTADMKWWKQRLQALHACEAWMACPGESLEEVLHVQHPM